MIRALLFIFRGKDLIVLSLLSLYVSYFKNYFIQNYYTMGKYKIIHEDIENINSKEIVK